MKHTKAGNPCIEKAREDEPIFVLRGQDNLAPALVRLWASRARALGCSSEKVQDAIECADAMEAYPTRKDPD
jgi:hypothetical protein